MEKKKATRHSSYREEVDETKALQLQCFSAFQKKTQTEYLKKKLCTVATLS